LSDDIIRILIGRITGRPLHEILREQVFEPLAMVDTGCSVPPGKIDRFSTCYFAQRSSGAPLEVWDERGGRFADEPIFPNQLASTVGDYFNFARMLLDDGMFRGFASTVYSRSIENGPRAGSYSWFGGYGPHFLVDKARGSALMLMIPRVVEGSNETRLGYAFELETYRTFLSDENL
jgi:CubicO group peptidase (beta-lactamase class C family)